MTEYKIRKVIHLTQLIPELQNILESTPKQLNFACADLMADYDVESQTAFVDICSIEATRSTSPPCNTLSVPASSCRTETVSFCRMAGARAKEEKKLKAPPKKITF